jgi:hypothetical protein
MWEIVPSGGRGMSGVATGLRSRAIEDMGVSRICRRMLGVIARVVALGRRGNRRKNA